MAAESSFLKNSLLTIIRQFSAIVLGLAITIITARYLGPDIQGKYTLVILLPTLLMMFMNFGLDLASVYYIGKNEIKLSDIYKTNLVMGSLISLASIAVGLIMVIFYSDLLFPNVPQALLLYSLISVPFIIINFLLQSIFQGKEDFKEYNSSLLACQAITLLFMLGLIIVLNLGLIGAVTSYMIGQMITFVMSQYWLWKKYKLSFFSGTMSVKYLKISFSYGWKVHVNSMMTFINYRASVVMLGIFIHAASVGIFIIAVNIAEQLWFFSRATSIVLFARVASLKTEDDKNQITALVSRIILMMSVIGGICFYFLSPFLIRTMFGSAYISGVSALQLLLPGVVAITVERVISSDMSARGKIALNMYVSICTCSLGIVLGLMMIPKYGINGAAAATSIVYTISFVAKVIMYGKVTGLHYREFLLITLDDLKLLTNYTIKFSRSIYRYRTAGGKS